MHGEIHRFETVAEALARLEREAADRVPPAIRARQLLARAYHSSKLRRLLPALAAIGILAIWSAWAAGELGACVARPIPRPWALSPGDAEHAASLSRDVEGRCVTWLAQLKDTEELLGSTGTTPMKISYSAPDVFSGARRKSRMLLEGQVRDGAAPLALGQQANARYLIRSFQDRPGDPAAPETRQRVVEATW